MSSESSSVCGEQKPEEKVEESVENTSPSKTGKFQQNESLLGFPKYSACRNSYRKTVEIDGTAVQVE